MNRRQQFEHRANTQIITLSEVTYEFAEPERLRLQLSPKVMKKPLDIAVLHICCVVRMKAFGMIAARR